MPCPFHNLFNRPSTPAEDTPPQPERRALLKGAGVMGGALALGSSGQALAGTESSGCSEEEARFTSREMQQPFYGPWQSGIINPQPASAALVSFDVLAQNRDDLKRLFQILTERCEFLTQGGTPPTTGDRFPPLDSGILGTRIPPDNLTITAAVGDSLFDDRFGLAGAKPRHLKTMTRFPNDALKADWCHGDLLLQICANSPDTVLHALRDIIKHTPALLSVRWRRDGFISSHTAAKMGQETPINLLGFRDGTVNPNPQDPDTLHKVILVSEQHDEPAWTRGGSYLAVRLIRFYVEQWDRTPLQEQQTIFGRDRKTGAPLGMQHEHDIPDYSQDPEGKLIPLDAHMRLANPREPGFEKHQLLRRPYNYSDSISASGQLDMGLMFIAYQADLDAGFITVQNRLNGEPLEEYIKPFGGGYFFALPGVRKSGNYLGQALLESV